MAARVADRCAQERADAAAKHSGLTEGDSQVLQWLRCKESEAKRIADEIRGLMKE